MRRSLIVVQQEPYDWGTAKQKVEEISRHFAAYLREFRSRRATGSKHAVLGPVGKLLNEASTVELSVDALLGYTLRVHEMSSQTSYLSPTALDHLRQGAEGLVDLIASAPIVVRSRLIAQVDDAVYYLHRDAYYRRLHAYMDAKQKAFAAFLRQKYGNDDVELRNAWGEESILFDDVPYPSRNQQQKALSKAKAEDMKAFWKLQRDEPAEEEEEME